MPTTGGGLSTTTLQYDALPRAPQSITRTLLSGGGGGRSRTATAVFPVPR